MVAQAYVVRKLRHCEVWIWPETHYLETHYPDGTKVPAAPEPTQDYLDRARAHGYGDDIWTQCREHEIAHTILAETRGMAASPVLWGLAHDAPIPQDSWWREERVTLAFQAWCNGDSGDALDILEEIGWTLPELCLMRHRLHTVATISEGGDHE